jgi:hypothetical protein
VGREVGERSVPLVSAGRHDGGGRFGYMLEDACCGRARMGAPRHTLIDFAPFAFEVANGAGVKVQYNRPTAQVPIQVLGEFCRREGPRKPCLRLRQELIQVPRSHGVGRHPRSPKHVIIHIPDSDDVIIADRDKMLPILTHQEAPDHAAV